jgi:hypothetical protein
MSHFKGFRRKNDQFELDGLRSDLRFLNGVQVIYNTHSLKIETPGLYANPYYSSYDEDEDAESQLRTFISTLNSYKHEYKDHQKLIKHFSITSSQVLQYINISLDRDLKAIVAKIKCANRIVSALQEFIKTGNVKYLDEYEYLYEELERLTAADRKKALLSDLSFATPHHYPSFAATALNYIELAKDTIKNAVLYCFVRLIVKIIRDIRQSFRNMVRLLFKNMDDNSGEAHDVLINNAHVVFHLNNQTHGREDRYSRIYKQAA